MLRSLGFHCGLYEHPTTALPKHFTILYVSVLWGGEAMFSPWHWRKHCHTGSLAQSKKVGLASSKYQLSQLTRAPVFSLPCSTKEAEKGMIFYLGVSYIHLSPLYTLLYIKNYKTGWKPLNFSSTWGMKCETCLNSSPEVISSLGESLHFTCTWSGGMSWHKPTPPTCDTDNKPFSSAFWEQIEEAIGKIITT